MLPRYDFAIKARNMNTCEELFIQESSSSNGEYVRYEDVETLLEELRDEIDLMIAGTNLVNPL